jgi:GxxExxY protein
MRIYAEVPYGLDEKIYENALCVDFAEQVISFSQQQRFPVYYHQNLLGTFIPDLIVQNTVIVDTKVVDCFNDVHIAQMLNYLKITNLEVGLLLNFKHPSLQIKRVINTPRNQAPPKLS